MAKAKMRTISFLLLTLFVIIYGILFLTTDYINDKYALLFVLVFALWGFLTDVLTKPNKRDDNNHGNN
ncbi:TPA: mobilization protein [Staphylococcus aureus]|nr:mobilization protein [Staphylococcus aureus]HDL0591400.1 mobilization protein [Staphylococcus aureus]